MIVYPAIDIRDGKCVRLIEGDFNRETVFGDNPAEMAKRWESAGAEWIHVVDLDGAKSGRRSNAAAIAAIRQNVSCKLQIGGGIRSEEDANDYLDMGCDRVILGTSAIHDGELVRSLSDLWPGQIAVGLDARNGKLAGDGWLEQTSIDAVAVASERLEQGASVIIYTDISQDGTLRGPNIPAILEMVGIAGPAVIASGGVGTIRDVEQVRESGAGGTIIGRGLYDGSISIEDAFAAAKQGEPVS